MYRNFILLIYVSCFSHGRRVQISVEDLQGNRLAENEKVKPKVDDVHRTQSADAMNELRGEPSPQHEFNPAANPAAAFNAHVNGAFFPKTSSKVRPISQSSQVLSSKRYPVFQDSSLSTSGISIPIRSPLMSVNDTPTDEAEAEKKDFEPTRQDRDLKHSESFSALNKKAALLRKDGQRAEAKPVMEEALELTEQVLGPENPETRRALQNYEELFGNRPIMSTLVKLGLKGYYRNFAVGSALVAFVVWLLRFVTSHVDALASAMGPIGASCTSPAAAIVAGTCAGALHTLAGPDHLAALAPLALRKRNPIGAFRTGMLWGVAHVVGQVLLGLSLLAASRSNFVMGMVSDLGLAAFGEQLAGIAVGVVLIVIGALGFKEIQEWADEDGEDEHSNSTGRFRTFLTGMLAGMQPDALLFCLPALALPSRFAGVCFLGAFGAGTLISMGGFTAALQAACVSFGQRAVKRVAAFSSVVAITFGTIVCGSAVGVPLLRAFL